MICLCARDSNSNIDGYKDFTQLIRRKELEETILLIDDNSTKKLKEYIHLLINIKLDETKYHVYFGEVKIVVNTILNFYTTGIDEIIKDADAYSNDVSRGDLKMLIDRTITIQQAKQDEFRKTFHLINNPWEKQVFDEIEKLYIEYLPKLNDIKDVIYHRLDKQSKVRDFAKGHFPTVVKNMSEIFDTAQLYVSMMLVENIKSIRISLEEIHHRLSNNLTELRKTHDVEMNNFFAQLYEKNKESMCVTRLDNKNCSALAEACEGIKHIKKKIENHRISAPLERLEKVVDYWATKLDYFNEIVNNLDQLKAMQTQLDEEQEKIFMLKCGELPECQSGCATKFRVAYSERREEVRLRIINETRALFTFFSARGSDRILYSDNIGPYYVDEFNHQNYFFNYGLGIYHLTCDGSFKEFPEHAYLFDKYGRYIVNEDGEKLYQCAPCTSQYKLNEATYFEKVTEDCGHAGKVNKRCRMDIRNPNDVAILPDIDAIDIKQTLNSETVQYLWDSLACVLPEALHDVATAKPKNPIHFLAHKILHHKYKRTISEHQKKKDEAEKYRLNVFKQREEKAAAASRLWKSKQVKRRKPEESDDAEFRAYLDARLAQDLFIHSLNMDI